MLTGDESPPTALSFLELLYGAGGRVLGPDGRAAVAGPAGRRALATLNRGWSDGAVTPSLDEDLAAVSGAFARGHGGVMPTESGLNPGGSSGGIRMAPLPHFAGQPPRPIVDGYGLAIPRRAPNRDGGLALLDGLTRAAAMQDFAPTGMASPLRASYGPGGVVATALRHGVPLAALPHSPAVIDAIARDVHAALAGDMSVDAALRRMAADIDSITRAPAGGAGA
jgi:multiple sugar transport system substrate-binding protein